MNSTDSGYTKVSGSLITYRFITSMQGDSVSFEYAHPSTFKIPWNPEDTSPDAKEYELRVREAFESLRSRWDMYELKLRSMNPDDVRKYWQRPLLEALGFNPVYTPINREISENLKFNFSHKGWKEETGIPKPPVVHIIPPSQGLDDRPIRGEPSAHDALQGYLNTNEDRWALLTNGIFLRLLRDFHHTTVRGYIEFDIEAIFHNRLYSDFQALYRFAHASRFAPVPLKKTAKTEASNEEESADTADIYLEEYFKRSQAVGESVGKDLKENVVKAIEAFGNGFLTNELMKILRADEKECHIYYEEILRVIYRIIFLLYAEQRAILGGHGGTNPALYLDNYSIMALRDFAIESIDDETLQHDTHQDLWEGLLTTFKMVKDGVEELGIYPYNGMLFDMSDKYVGKYSCKNSEFMKAISYLTSTDGTIRQIISYADLSVEEFGAIYESLLEYSPRITVTNEVINGIQYQPNRFILDPRSSDRKSTGSYYTNRDLVQELIKSALDPVIKSRLNEAADNSEAKIKAILSIKVCDMACGSGAFLIAACDRLGYELARIKSGEELPAQAVEQDARREVLLHCIYGVDLNPMAVELAKVSLWINAAVRDKPLNFLDHHIKCGNSLIGTTPELMQAGIPDGAFTPVEGDNKKVANHFKKINKEFLRKIKEQHKSSSIYKWVSKDGSAKICSVEFAKLGDEIEFTPEQVKEKKEHYESLLASKKYNRIKFLADLWTSAFFWELTNEKEEVPTNKTYLTLANNEDISPGPEFERKITELARKYHFFHWQLEFPEVFSGEKPGFDCVLGNPPWEVISFEEKQFFSEKDPKIANANNGAARKKMIQELKIRNSKLYMSYSNAFRDAECLSKFLKESNRFPLTAIGKINTYAIFTENSRDLINNLGRSGLIVPTGIATDNNTSRFFGDVVKKEQLVSLHDFENKNGLFPIHRSFKFCLLTINGVDFTPSIIDFSFFLHTVDEINEYHRHFTLTTKEINLINPNTLNCPMFKNKIDAEIVKDIYRRVPVLSRDTNNKNENPWRISFKQGLFNMTSDSNLFKTKNELEELGFELDGNQYIKGNETFLPLYEGKMIWQLNHRKSSVNYKGRVIPGSHDVIELGEAELANIDFCPMPRFWVNINEVKNRVPDGKKYFIGFRDITNATSERTTIFSFIPFSGVGHQLPLVFVEKRSMTKELILASIFNSIILDFVARRKVGGNHMTYFILKQLPIIDSTRLSSIVTSLIFTRTIELTYTAWDLKPFAEDVLEEIGLDNWNKWFPNNPLVMGIPQPFKWDEERRLQLRCELDAIYAHLYGISKGNLEYILGTFPIVKKKEEAKYGTYKTKDLILDCYDRYLGLMESVNTEIKPAILGHLEGHNELSRHVNKGMKTI